MVRPLSSSLFLSPLHPSPLQCPLHISLQWTVAYREHLTRASWGSEHDLRWSIISLYCIFNSHRKSEGRVAELEPKNTFIPLQFWLYVEKHYKMFSSVTQSFIFKLTEHTTTPGETKKQNNTKSRSWVHLTVCGGHQHEKWKNVHIYCVQVQ